MTRSELETKGLTPEQIDFVLASYGKGIQAEQEKAKTAAAAASEETKRPLEAQLAELNRQVAEYQEKIKSSGGVDESAKAEIAELQKAHAASMREVTSKHEAELAKLQREAETREFFSGLSRKFITPETRRAFEQRVNEALSDKAYEGRNRAEIFAVLAKGEDGKERADIFVPDSTAKPAATGTSGESPNTGTVYTMEQIRNMTPEQINKNWDSVKKTIEGGK